MGNGVDGRKITIQNSLLNLTWIMIFNTNNTSSTAHPTMWGLGLLKNTAKDMDRGLAIQDGLRIKNIGIGFFTVSNSIEINQEGDTYSYIAFGSTG